MNEPRQRIVVDGVAFSQVFRFQKILSAITHAMQPPRLLVALFMVVALVAVGRMWDAWSGDPTIHPQGILSGLPERMPSGVRRRTPPCARSRRSTSIT